MHIINIEYPGTWLQLEDKEKEMEIINLLNLMETSIIDASISLSMFQESQIKSLTTNNRYEFEINREIETNIRNKYCESLSKNTNVYEEYHQKNIKKLVREEKIRQGIIPRRYANRPVFIAAQSFLSSIDSFGKFLTVIFKETNIESINLLIDELYTEIPTVKKIRNSFQHLEDRSRGYGKPHEVRKKIKMKLKPIDNQIIKSSGGALILSCLNGNKLGCTIDDGSYQEIEISLKTLNTVVELFQRLLNSFTWIGSSRDIY